MKPEHKHWVLHGTPDWKGGNDAWKHQWYGVQRFFDWLETKAYKMRARAAVQVPQLHAPPCLQWRAPEAGRAALAPGHEGEADAVLPPDDGRYRRFMPVGASWTRANSWTRWTACRHDVMLLPIERVRLFFDKLSFTGALTPPPTCS